MWLVEHPLTPPTADFRVDELGVQQWPRKRPMLPDGLRAPEPRKRVLVSSRSCGPAIDPLLPSSFARLTAAMPQ